MDDGENPAEGTRNQEREAGEIVTFSTDLPSVEGRDELTCSEKEVARLLIDGHSNAEIAEKRERSVRTIANQVASIFDKLEVGSRAEFVAFLMSAAEP